jgi:hypothetical protein
MAFGRLFPIGKEGRYKLQVRAEFQNIFNRLFYSAPSNSGATTITSLTAHNNPGGTLSSGWGFVPWVNGVGSQPRSGQIVARFTF